MSAIDRVRKKILSGEYEFSIPHFFEEMVADQLSFSDIKNAILKGRIDRKFTRDPRGTRYEVIGPARDGRKIAVLPL